MPTGENCHLCGLAILMLIIQLDFISLWIFLFESIQSFAKHFIFSWNFIISPARKLLRPIKLAGYHLEEQQLASYDELDILERIGHVYNLYL